jgi:hypothetical protein
MTPTRPDGDAIRKVKAHAKAGGVTGNCNEALAG